MLLSQLPLDSLSCFYSHRTSNETFHWFRLRMYAFLPPRQYSQSAKQIAKIQGSTQADPHFSGINFLTQGGPRSFRPRMRSCVDPCVDGPQPVPELPWHRGWLLALWTVAGQLACRLAGQGRAGAGLGWDRGRRTAGAGPGRGSHEALARNDQLRPAGERGAPGGHGRRPPSGYWALVALVRFQTAVLLRYGFSSFAAPDDRHETTCD